MNSNKPTREQYRAMFQLWVNLENIPQNEGRKIVSVRYAERSKDVWIELCFPINLDIAHRGSSYDTYWVYIDRHGYAYNDKPSEYYRFESDIEHRERIEQFELLWKA